MSFRRMQNNYSRLTKHASKHVLLCAKSGLVGTVPEQPGFQLNCSRRQILGRYNVAKRGDRSGGQLRSRHRALLLHAHWPPFPSAPAPADGMQCNPLLC